MLQWSYFGFSLFEFADSDTFMLFVLCSNLFFVLCSLKQKMENGLGKNVIKPVNESNILYMCFSLRWQ